jgi:hypothetical protein
MNKLSATLILFFFTWSLYAQLPTSMLIERHKLDYQIQTTLLVSNQILQELVTSNILPKQNSTEQVSDIHNAQKAEDFTAYLIQDMSKLKRDTFILLSKEDKGFLERTKADSANPIRDNFLADFKHNSRKIARLHGVTAVSVWFLSEFVQIISIPVTAAIGAPEIGLMLVASPLNFINMAITIKAIDISNQINLKHAYGGAKNKRASNKIKRNLYRDYKIKNENTLLHFLELKNDTNYFISVNRNNIFTEIFSFLRLNQHKLYYTNLKRFSRKQVNGDTLLAILDQKGISREMRSLYAAIYLHQTHPELFNQFTALYHQSMVKIASKNKQLMLRTDVKNWVFTVCEIRNIKELDWALRQMPPDVKVHEVMDLFDAIILKYWALHMNKQNFKAFRKMIKGFKKTNYQLLNQSDEYFTAAHTDVLLLNCGLFYSL